MPTLTSLTVNLKGDASSLVRASRSGLASVRRLSNGIGGTVARVAGLAGAIAGLAGSAGLLALGRAASQNVDRIGKLSTQLGVSGTEVQKLGLIAELSGMKTEGLVKAMQRITRIVGDAGAGGKEAAKLFDRLGLSVDDLIKAAPLERFRKVIVALGGIRAATEQAAVGNKLFEEQWQRIVPLLEGFESNARRASAVFDVMKFGIGDGAKEVERLNDNFSVVSAMLVGFRDLVFAKVSPAISELVEGLGSLAEAWIKANGGASVLADTLITKVTGAIKRLGPEMEALMNAATGIAWTFNAIVDSVKALGNIGAGIAAAGGAIASGDASRGGWQRTTSAIMGQALSDAWAQFTGGSAGGSGADGQLDELRQQTSLLRDLSRGGVPAVLR